jgi:nucleoside 2-deoxyribosyltransferase
MYYHAKFEYEGKSHRWWNHTKDKLMADLLIPFINGQIILINRKGHKSILNMKNVTHVTVYRTPKKLAKPAGIGHPVEFDTGKIDKFECTAEIVKELKVEHAAASTRSILQKTLTPTEPQVFVIMKFGDNELDSAYEGVIKPIIEEFDLRAIRIDEIQDSGKITDQILEHIARSKYVLADLTGERPNCYYECGFAHALGKELIFTIKASQNIHFDLAGYRFITWNTEADLRRKLRQRLNNLEQADQVE